MQMIREQHESSRWLWTFEEELIACFEGISRLKQDEHYWEKRNRSMLANESVVAVGKTAPKVSTKGPRCATYAEASITDYRELGA